MRALRLSLWLLVAVALFGLGVLTVRAFAPRAGGEVAAAVQAPLGGAFSLVDDEGRPVTEALFRGGPSATFFGFTHCPDVCPTALMDMARWEQALGADADKLRFVFVTVDPERDSADLLDGYLSSFSERLVGVTGDPAAVAAMLKDYKIYSRKVPLEGDDYTMDHTASIILQDSDGNFVGTIARGESDEAAMAKLRRLVAG